MGTFTKSFGAAGGYIAGNKSLIDTRLRVSGHSGAYAEAMTPSVLTQIIASMASIMGVALPSNNSPTTILSSSSTRSTPAHEEEYQSPGPVPPSSLPQWVNLPPALASGKEGTSRLRRLAFNSRYLHNGLIKLGFITYGHPAAPIVPLLLFIPGKINMFHRMMKDPSPSASTRTSVSTPTTPRQYGIGRQVLSGSGSGRDFDYIGSSSKRSSANAKRDSAGLERKGSRLSFGPETNGNVEQLDKPFAAAAEVNQDHPTPSQARTQIPTPTPRRRVKSDDTISNPWNCQCVSYASGLTLIDDDQLLAPPPS
jgi:hypothetical protein